MAEVDSLSIEIKSSAKAASSAIDEVIKKLEGLNNVSLDNLNKQLNQITSSTSQLASNLSGKLTAGMNSASSSATHLTGAFGSLWQMLKKVAVIAGTIKLFKQGYGYATSYFEGVNYFNVAMGQFAEEAYDYAKKVSEALGLDENQWMTNQATFMSLAATFGNTADNAYLMSKNLTQLVYDLSSLKDVKADVAMQKLRSAFAGEIEPLRDWGVDLSKANLQLQALNLGITKTFNNMTQAEKSQLRYYTIMHQLSYAMGDLSKTLDSPANQLRLLETAVQKVARAFGNIFIPILNQVIPILIAVANAVRNLFETIAAFFGFKYPEVTNWDRYSEGVNGVGDAMDKTGKRAKKLKQQLAGFDEINNLTTNKGGGGGAGGAGGWANFELPTYESLGKDFLGAALDQRVNSVLTDLPQKLIDFLKKVREKIASMDWQSLGQAFGEKLSSVNWVGLAYQVVAFIGDALTAALTFLAASGSGVWDAIKQVITGAFLAFMKFVRETDWFRVMYEIGTFLGSALLDVATLLVSSGGDIFGAVFEIVSGIWMAFAHFMKDALTFVYDYIFAPIVDAFKSLFGIASPSKVMFDLGEMLVEGFANALSGIWPAVSGFITGLYTNITGVFKAAWSVISQGAKDAWAAIKNVFSPVASWFKEKFTAAWTKVKEVFSTGGQIFSGIKEGIENAFKAVVNALITGINKIIKVPFEKIKDMLTTIKNVTILGLKPFSFINVSWSIPQIPKLATGGVIGNPTIAMLGEDGAEAVVPLEHNTEWINKVAAQINEQGNDDVVKALEVLIGVVRDKELIVDGKSLARGMAKEINRQTRILGEGMVY